MWTNPRHSHCQLSLHGHLRLLAAHHGRTPIPCYHRSLVSNRFLPASALLSLFRYKRTTLYISTLHILPRFDRVKTLPLAHPCLDHHTGSHRNQHIACLPHAFLPIYPLDSLSWCEEKNRIKLCLSFPLRLVLNGDGSGLSRRRLTSNATRH